jgi:hypothetical protein
MLNVEQIIGYSFKNKVWCTVALQMSVRETTLVVGGQVYVVNKNQNLAVLGDKVLDMVLCKLWFRFRNARGANAASPKDSGIMASARQCFVTRTSTPSVGHSDSTTRSLPALASPPFPKQW